MVEKYRKKREGERERSDRVSQNDVYAARTKATEREKEKMEKKKKQKKVKQRRNKKCKEHSDLGFRQKCEKRKRGRKKRKGKRKGKKEKK